jgi:hypothetical protein
MAFRTPRSADEANPLYDMLGRSKKGFPPPFLQPDTTGSIGFRAGIRLGDRYLM